VKTLQSLKIPLIVGIISLLVGRYVLTPKQEVKQVIKIVEVEKNVKEEKKKIKTRIKETVANDGTRTIETNIDEDSGTRETNVRDTKIDSKTISKTGSGLTLGLLAIKDASNFSKQTEYGATIAVPLIGNLKVIGLATTGKQVGLGLGLEF
jgi:hypothetical protein